MPETGFNPRAHAGRDDRPAPSALDRATFQSTRPRGARPTGSNCGSGPECFNPRAHAGRDPADIQERILVYVSIHAPTRGATTARRPGSTCSLFQSTRPRGARLCLNACFVTFTMFQSTRPRGARLCLNACFVTFTMFQSTRPRGARPRRMQTN